MWTISIGALLHFSNLSVTLGANLLVQSTPLIATGLIVARLLRGRGATLQSAILRATLAAVVLCPLASLCLSKMGVSGLALRLPHATMPQVEVSAPIVAPEPNPPERFEFLARSEADTQPSPLPPPDHSKTAPGAAFDQAAKSPLLASRETPAARPAGLVILYTALTAVWSVVSGFLLVRLLLAHVRMARVRRLAKGASATLTTICRALAQDMHVRPPVLLMSPSVKSPCLIGFFSPAILLPESEDGVDPRRPHEIFAHELSHLIRRDCTWNLLGHIARAVLFFQPLLWTLSRRIEETSDEVADDYVVQHGADRQSYASQLVAIAERYQPTPSELIAGAGVIAFKSSLGRRVQRILDTTRALSDRVGARAVVAIILLGLCGTLAAGLVGAKGPNSGSGAQPALPNRGGRKGSRSVPDDSDSKAIAEAAGTEFSLSCPDIKTAIEAAYKARSELLANSAGRADLTIERDFPSPEAAERMKEETGFDPKGFGYGKGGWTVTWYKKGVKNRYDVMIPPPKEKDPRGRSYLLKHTNKRIAVDPEKEVCYDILHEEAYIKRPSGEGGNPYGLVDEFRIGRLYEFGLDDVPGLLDYLEKEKMQRKLTEQVIGQTRCIKLEFSEDKIGAHGRRDRRLFELWVAPEMSYSLVKAQASSSWPGSEELILVESYDATYEESPTFPGTWLLKDLRIFDRSGPFPETLTASLRDTKVGVEIPDETFTFKGLGVPKGTKLYDRRVSPPKELQYDGSAIEEPDGGGASSAIEGVAGEWEGSWRDDLGGGGKLSAQVTDEGEGSYRAVLTAYVGKAVKLKGELQGTQKGNTIRFEGTIDGLPSWGEIAGHKFTGTWDPKGDIWFEMTSSVRLLMLTGQEQDTGSGIIEKLKAFDDTVLQQHTATFERVQDKDIIFDFDPVGFRETVTVTVDGDTTAYSVSRYYDKEPSFPKKKLEPTDYDREGNFVVWRDTNRQGLIGPDLNANRAQRTVTSLNPDNKVVLKDEAAPSVEFKPVATKETQETFVVDYLVPILCTGRGFGNSLVRVKEIIEETANEITFTAYGRFGRDEALWKLTVDTQNAYLVRSAEFYAEGRPPILSITTKGTKWFGDLCVAETFTYWISEPDNVVAGKVKKYEPKANRELIANIHKTFTQLSPNTDVVDWRGHSKDPLMYRVGHR